MNFKVENFEICNLYLGIFVLNRFSELRLATLDKSLPILSTLISMPKFSFKTEFILYDDRTTT